MSPRSAAYDGGNFVPEDAVRYVELLKATYPRVKAVDPVIVVVAGALSSTGVTQPDLAVADMTYLKAMYAYNDGEIKSCVRSIVSLTNGRRSAFRYIR